MHHLLWRHQYETNEMKGGNFKRPEMWKIDSFSIKVGKYAGTIESKSISQSTKAVENKSRLFPEQIESSSRPQQCLSNANIVILELG